MAGIGLVAAQFCLIGTIVWLVGIPEPAPLPALLAAAGALLGLWTLAHNRPGNFNIRPHPKTGACLVTGGPYRWMRHPMYTALMLFLAGVLVAAPSVVGWGAFAALAVVLAAKARLEESLLRRRFPGYAGYAARTGRFVPAFW